MIYLLDTDVFTLAYYDRGGVRERVHAVRVADEVVLSLITRIEVLRGRFETVAKAADGAAILRAQDWLRASDQFLAGFRVLPFDANAVATFDRLRED